MLAIIEHVQSINRSLLNRLRPMALGHVPLHADPVADANGDLRTLLDAWLPLTYALNAVNRSMGANDLYPFVLAPKVLDKLRFVHDLVEAHPVYHRPAEAVRA